MLSEVPAIATTVPWVVAFLLAKRKKMEGKVIKVITLRLSAFCLPPFFLERTND